MKTRVTFIAISCILVCLGFSAQSAINDQVSNINQLFWTDLNEDNHRDALMHYSDESGLGSIIIQESEGADGFKCRTLIENMHHIFVMDLNKDGQKDILGVNKSGSKEVMVALINSKGRFERVDLFDDAESIELNFVSAWSDQTTALLINGTFKFADQSDAVKSIWKTSDLFFDGNQIELTELEAMRDASVLATADLNNDDFDDLAVNFSGEHMLRFFLNEAGESLSNFQEISYKGSVSGGQFLVNYDDSELAFYLKQNEEDLLFGLNEFGRFSKPRSVDFGDRIVANLDMNGNGVEDVMVQRGVLISDENRRAILPSLGVSNVAPLVVVGNKKKYNEIVYVDTYNNLICSKISKRYDVENERLLICISDDFLEQKTRMPIREVIEFSTYVYPNPTPSLFTIEIETGKSEDHFVVDLVNTSGVVLRSINVAEKRQLNLELDGLSNGQYFVVINNKTTNQKLVKSLMKGE